MSGGEVTAFAQTIQQHVDEGGMAILTTHQEVALTREVPIVVGSGKDHDADTPRYRDGSDRNSWQRGVLRLGGRRGTARV